MKTLRYAVIFMAFVTCFTAKSQDRIVERDGQVIILQEGQRTDMAIDNRYIYRNDVDTAYALIVGHIYTFEEVEQAFGTPNDIQGEIYDIPTGTGSSFKEGTLVYVYADFSFSISHTTGLCSFDIRWEDISFYDYGRIVKAGDNISVLADDSNFQAAVVKQSNVFTDEKTGKRSIGIAINSTGDDDWVYYTFGMDTMDGLNITISYMGYQQIN